MTERAKTGIPGLDDLLDGGFPRGRTILLSGATGTGKTIFGLQFLYHGATIGEPGVLLTLEEKPSNLRAEMKQFGMDMLGMEKEGKLAIIDASLVRLGLESDEKFTLSPESFDINHLIQNLIMTARNMGAKRVVVDALPSLDILLDNDKQKVRNAIIEMNYLLQENNLTSILLSEIPVGGQSYAPHGVEEFVVDGVITLHYETFGTEAGRSIIIRKMRMTHHTENVTPFSIESGKGISIVSL